MYDNLAILAAFAFLFSAIAGRIERSAITGPIIYVLYPVHSRSWPDGKSVGQGHCRTAREAILMAVSSDHSGHSRCFHARVESLSRASAQYNFCVYS